MASADHTLAGRGAFIDSISFTLSTNLRTLIGCDQFTTFGVIPKAEALSCLRMVLFDFRGHNVDMCCAMVDSMGPFLYRSTDSHGKVKILLEVMLKKRDRINDPRQQYALCCLSSPSLPKFGNIPYLASVIAILSSYHDWIGMSVVLRFVVSYFLFGLDLCTRYINELK
uniref:Uncharacterized protein n=1 Tax=Parascaris equorum TaxID=6256 RepID=A0A914S430_PAREQ